MAGVRSMTGSWHNFFFNAFDPVGFVSLDKPPVAFWIQTGSAKLFGFSAFSVLLPQLLEGVSSILVLYQLVDWRAAEETGRREASSDRRKCHLRPQNRRRNGTTLQC